MLSPTTFMQKRLNDNVFDSLKKKQNFYIYRLPDSDTFHFGASDILYVGCRENSFVFAPFENDGRIFSICDDECSSGIIGKDERKHNSIAPEFPFPENSTTKDEHRIEIEAITGFFRNLDTGKTVAARAILIDRDIDIAATFLNLCDAYPNAFIFCFHTPESGLWIGATPETLLKANSGKIETMALAGTRKVTDSSEAMLVSAKGWDEKNIEEQQIVARYIRDMLLQNGINPFVSQLYTRKAGPVEHLCNIISAENRLDNDEVSRLLTDLSPTPALCGFPKSESLRLINKYENFKRGYYGGFCGFYKNSREFDIFVNLRSMIVSDKRLCLFAGGGITKLSDAESEWNETELKASTLIDKLEFRN